MGPEQQKVEIEIDLYNRIHNWKISLCNAEKALDLCTYFNKELFSKQENDRCVPHNIAQSGLSLSFDMPAIYYMRIFSSGYGVEGEMHSNKQVEIEAIRTEMISYVRTEMSWSEDDWNQFHDSMTNLRNSLIAHFDANAVKFDDDAKGYSYKNNLMKPNERKRLRKVISLMKEFISRFKEK